MAPVQTPARDLIVQVRDADGTTWLGIAGSTNFKLNPSENAEYEETTTRGSGGAYEEVPMQRGAMIEIEGRHISDSITGVQDAGQKRCEDLAAAVGYAGVGAIRFRHPLATVWKQWVSPGAVFELSEQGGGNNNMTSWGVKIRRSGVTTTAAVA
ncbi:MAG TPA: hypothetical protein VFM37_05980 [Pseudonocardiaceae bacterium]|nr:hypothetical protein [Pseudonocardiaceae bacterium]